MRNEPVSVSCIGLLSSHHSPLTNFAFWSLVAYPSEVLVARQTANTWQGKVMIGLHRLFRLIDGEKPRETKFRTFELDGRGRNVL